MGVCRVKAAWLEGYRPSPQFRREKPRDGSPLMTGNSQGPTAAAPARGTDLTIAESGCEGLEPAEGPLRGA